MATFTEERIGPCRLILGDAVEVLPTLSGIDACITDPVWPNAPDGMFAVEDPYELLRDVFLMLDPGVKRIAICMRTDSDPRILTAVPPRYEFVRHQNLEYVATGYLGRVLGGMEVVYGFGTPIKSAEHRRVIPGNAPKAQPSKVKYDHPCPRNEGHTKWVVYWWSDEGETVLDPFMGTGTAGVACINTDRKFVGVEKVQKYFDIACERIERAWLAKQSELPFEKPAAMTQRAFSM